MMARPVADAPEWRFLWNAKQLLSPALPGESAAPSRARSPLPDMISSSPACARRTPCSSFAGISPQIAGSGPSPFCGDIGDFETVRSLFSRIRRLDVLVNNAGISHVGLLSDMTPEEWRRIMATNLDGCFYTCKLAVPLMVHEKRGKILNISSIWGNAGASMETAYSASKGAVNSLTKALAKELAPSNIQVNAIACGVIDTDMNRCFSEEEMQALIDEIPADRLGTPEEVALLALQLTQSPAYLTGQVITLDGGFL